MGQPGCGRDELRIMARRDDGADAGEAPKCSTPSTRSSGRSRNGSSLDRCRVQLPEIVDGTEQRPLLADPGETPPEELAKAARVLDLPEDRLDDRLAPRIAAAAASGPELTGHAFADGDPGRGPAAGRRPWRRGVRVALRRDEWLDSPALQRRDVGLGPVPCVGQHACGFAAQSRNYGGDHWLQLFDILRAVNEAGTAVVLVEQFVHMALENSHRAYVLRKGEVVAHGKSADLREDDRLIASYLGETAGAGAS